MKKLLVFLFAFVSLYVHSQTACSNAQPFCAGGTSGVTFPATTGTGNSQQVGCLYTTPNAAWYYMQISTSGNLDVLIAGQLPNGNAGYDVDFICWGPFSTLAGACNSLALTNTVDCSYSGSYTETLNIPSGVTGQYYMVMITNFSDSTQNIIFNQIGGTGNTDCTILQASSPTICAGSNATIVATNSQSLTSPNYSINPGGLTNNTGSFVVSPTTTTHYTLYITGLNSQNATVTQTAASTVSVSPQPIFAPTFTQATCTNSVNAANMHLTFNPPTPAPSYTTVWSGSNPSVTTPTAVTASPLGAGPYTVVATAAGGCSAVAQFTMDQQPAQAIFTMTPLGSNFSVTCAQPTLVLYTTNANLTYTFTNGFSAPIMDTEAAISSANAGHYTVTATNPVSGCMTTSTFVVVTNTVAPPVTITPTLQNISCLSGVTTVTASTSSTLANGSLVFHFEPGTVASSNGTTAITSPPVGTHTVCAVDNSNGCSTCKEFSVTSNDAFPSLSVSSPQNFTVGCGAAFNVAHVNISGVANGGSASYTILTTATTYTTNGITSYTFATPGTYTAIVHDNASQCETKVPFSIISNTAAPNLQVSIPETVLTCAVSSEVLSGYSTNPSVAYTWQYPGTNGPASVANSTLLVNTNTNTTNPALGSYTLTIKDNLNGCSNSTVVTIRQNTYPPLVSITGGTSTISTSITCSTPSVNLNNSSHTGVPLAAGFPTTGIISAVEWDAPSPELPAFSLTNYTAYAIGVYTLHAMDQSNGCVGTGTFNILDGRIYPVLVTNSVILDCGTSTNNIISVAATNGTTGLTYLWPTDNTGLSYTGTNTLAILHPLTPGVYRAVVTNSINGCSSTGTAQVLPGSLSANFAPNQTSGYAPLNVVFANNSTTGNNNNTGITTVWSFGNGTQFQSDSVSTSPSVIYNQPGTYTVTIFASKGAGCQDTAIRYVTVDIPSKLEIPNVFTPNGDNVNDVFFLHASNLTEIHTMIYDRWGHKVYDLTSTTGNIAWDGKNDSTGKDAAAGTYFYIIKATGKDGQTFDTKGTVSLYR